MTGALTGALADFAATVPGAGIPSTARAAAARCLLDMLACAAAGLAEESSAEVCEPLGGKVRPKTSAHARFSLPYALACVAHHGTVTLADLTEQGIRTEAIDALRYAPSVSTLSDNLRLAGGPPLRG